MFITPVLDLDVISLLPVSGNIIDRNDLRLDPMHSKKIFACYLRRKTKPIIHNDIASNAELIVEVIKNIYG